VWCCCISHHSWQCVEAIELLDELGKERKQQVHSLSHCGLVVLRMVWYCILSSCCRNSLPLHTFHQLCTRCCEGRHAS
jgi:hypothetical protein